MASRKEYAYYLSGNRIGIVEKDNTGADDGLNYTYVSGAGISIPSGSSNYKSPLTTVADGIEIEYVYSPTYRINETEDKDTQIDTYVSTGGLLKLIDQGDNDYTLAP